ncbi:hypoxanthine phosphoribosyltransferase [Bacteroidetes/Chlorobi group bacterium ChocPot_Mid]|jgi:hypoxanthine phosphoribosyltransferase|nr:MAG: hypoxanthine phosphoribosyltransferase [Bacteroidetes/Chlorobi group bacterium ChocPot_Mid]
MGYIDNTNKEIYEIRNVRFKKYISKEIINQEVQKIANRINNDYAGQKVLFIVVLKGSIFFASDLLRKIELDCEIETVRASSYGDEMINSKLRLSIENINMFNKNIIIVEDIVDTGNTLSELVKRIQSEKPKSVEIVTFLSKPEKREKPLDIKYVGIEIAPYFVIGYGLDYAEQGRNLPDIYILDEERQ